MLYSGLGGEWTDYAMCPDGEYVLGAQIKVEEDLGNGGDDSGMTGLRLYCGLPCSYVPPEYDPVNANPSIVTVYEGD